MCDSLRPHASITLCHLPSHQWHIYSLDTVVEIMKCPTSLSSNTLPFQSYCIPDLGVSSNTEVCCTHISNDFNHTTFLQPIIKPKVFALSISYLKSEELISNIPQLKLYPRSFRIISNMPKRVVPK